MPTIIQSRRKLKSRLDAKQDVWRAIPALMGNGSGTIEIPNQPGYVYIRLGDNDLGQAFNNRCPLTDNLAIYVGYDPVVDPDRRIFQVLGVRMADYAGGGSTPVPNVGAHHITHEFGGGDDVYIDWRRLMGLRVGRPVLLTVTVDQGVIFRGGVWLPVTSQTTPPLTVPGLSTQAYYALIALDSAGVVTIAYGPPVAIATLTIANCPVPAVGEIPLAAVRLRGGQTVITDTPSAPDIVDLRFPTYNTMSLYVTPHNVLSASHSDSLTGAVLDGDVVIGNVTPRWSRLGISIPAANVRNVFGIDNAELRPSWKTTLDATNPTTIGIGDAGGPGTSLIYSHRDHQHPSPTTWTATAHAIDSATHTVAGRTAGQVLIATAAATFGWSGFLLSGTAGGSVNFAVTNAKTLILTSADDFNLTAERTGAVLVRTGGAAPNPQIVADAVGAGNARGQYAVDLQLIRVFATGVASGDYSSIGGGYGNIASGQYAVALGGRLNTASGQIAYAAGHAAISAHNTSFVWSDGMSIAFSSITDYEFAICARGGFRHAYDNSNYWTAKVASNGVTTFATLPVGAGFIFTPPITLSSVTASTIIYADAGRVIVSLANAAGYLYNSGAGAFSYVAAPLPGSHNVLSSTYHSDALTGSITRGDILYGNVTPKIARLAKGAAFAVLTGDGTDTAWSTYLLSGTAGGKTVFAVTNAKTLTLTATDDSGITFTGACVLTIPTAGAVTAALLGTANVFTANQTISNSAPSLVLTDTTGGAKSLTIAVDANIANLRESAGAAGSLLVLDLTANKVGIGTATPAEEFSVSNAGNEGLEIDPVNTDQVVYATAFDRVGGVYTKLFLRGSILSFGQGTTNKLIMGFTSAVLKIAGTAVRATTEGTNHLDIFDGTAPVGTLTNGCSIYSASGELWTMDAGGNATQQTPHNEQGEWIFYSKNTVTGKAIKIDMEKMLKELNRKFGFDFIHEYTDA